MVVGLVAPNEETIHPNTSNRVSSFANEKTVVDNGNDFEIETLTVADSDVDEIFGFWNGDKTKQGSSSKNSRKSKTRGFMNPKVNTAKGNTKDAGKRRVQADGQGTGHWLTNGDGKRVYVAINGQEMTGKAAYIHYKKESGGGFKNKKKRRKLPPRRNEC